MDLRFNRDEASEAEIKTEVKAALQMFEDAKNTSPLLRRFLSSLSDVLRKHKVHFTDPSAMRTNSIAGFTHEITLDTFNNPSDYDQMQYTQLGMEIQDQGIALETSFDESWQIAMQGEQSPDSLTWDNMFSTLDSRPL